MLREILRKFGVIQLPEVIEQDILVSAPTRIMEIPVNHQGPALYDYTFLDKDGTRVAGTIFMVTGEIGRLSRKRPRTHVQHEFTSSGSNDLNFYTTESGQTHTLLVQCSKQDGFLKMRRRNVK